MGSLPALLLAFGTLATVLAGAAPARAETLSARVVQEGTDFARGHLSGGLSLRGGGLRAATGGTYLSAPLDAGQAFTAIGPHWRGAPAAELELSVSEDGIRWGRWIAVPREGTIEELREDGEPNPLAGETLGALVFVAPGSRFVRYRVRLPAGPPGEADLGRISFHVIEAGAVGPDAPPTSLREPAPEEPDRPAGLAKSGRQAAAPPPEEPDPIAHASKPPIYRRVTWGARPPKAGYSYTLANHIGFHHTATVADWSAETWEECAARLRAIQTYHMDTNGWNDIGYAWVICKHGDVFQAREDDDDASDVHGAHDGLNRGSTGVSLLGYFHPPVDHHPTEAQVASLVDLMAWISSLRGIDPLGRSLYEPFGGPVDNVYGHREVKATDCPGNHLFELKEHIRTSVSDRLLVMPL
jgi:hypothetical protein